MTDARWLLVAVAVASTCASAGDWRSDASASRLDFVASFERAPAPGRFKAFDARVRLDPERLQDSRVDVTIDVGSADMSNGDVNRAIRGAEWFDAARFPQSRFHATQLVRSGPGRYLASGTLELKGVQRPVDVPFEWSESGGAATMTGELTLPRAAFAIGTGEWARTDVIGPDVVVRFRLRLSNAS
jgi:polyisoprenoid-binding protein YceI